MARTYRYDDGTALQQLNLNALDVANILTSNCGGSFYWNTL